MPVSTKRIYEPPSHGDGYRVLIDGIWPRGITRERAAVDQWARELAQARSCGGGTGTSRSASRSSLAAIAPSSAPSVSG